MRATFTPTLLLLITTLIPKKVTPGWGNIVTQNTAPNVTTTQAFASYNQTALLTSLETTLNTAFTQINALPATTGYTDRTASSLNGINTQNSVDQLIVINVTDFNAASTKLNITGDAGDIFVIRWDEDLGTGGYQGQVKFQSGGGIVPLGGLTPGNFINVAGDIASSGGGTNPASPYPQGPRYNNGQGALIEDGANFNGGGFLPATGSPPGIRRRVKLHPFPMPSSRVGGIVQSASSA